MAEPNGSGACGVGKAQWVCGVDLSGPANPAGTALVWCACGTTCLTYRGTIWPASDADVLDQITVLARSGPLAVGIDAPLSYEDGGGMRSCDRELARTLKANGSGFVGVMSPTLSRMVYVTLRGIGLARAMQGLNGSMIRIAEVHPGATMALRGAPEGGLRSYKKATRPAADLCQWLVQQGLRGLSGSEWKTSHEVDAAAAALATWKWLRQESVWLAPAQPPARPYDFAC